MDLKLSRIILLSLEGFGCIALIGIIAYCLRKRKRNGGDGSNDDETKVSIRDNKIFPSKPKGIPNVGASCYMNSMLQCLAWSPCLRKQLENQVKKLKPKEYKGKLATSLLSLLQLYHGEDEQTNNSYDKRQLKNVKLFCKELVKEKDYFDGRSQEDIFEFYNTLICGLEEEALRNVSLRSKEKNVTDMEHIMQTCDVTRLFGGMFMTCFCYKECGHVDPVFQRFTSLSVSPVVTTKKRQRSPGRLETDSASGSVDESAPRDHSAGQSTRIVDDTAQIVNIEDHQMSTQKGHGMKPLSQESGENRNRIPNETSMTKYTTNPNESSDAVPKRNKGIPEVHNHSPIAEELEETGMKPSKNVNIDGKGIGNTDHTNDTNRNTALLDIDKVSPNLDHQESLSDGSLDDIKKLPSLRLVKRNNESNRQRTDLELCLDQWAEFEEMKAGEVPCRMCTDKKEHCGGVLYKQFQLVALPHVLVLHINRFKQEGSQLYKVDDFVSYPDILDMTEFCSKASEKLLHGQRYSLFGVVNHQGSMRGGHYSAFIKTNQRDVQYIQNQLQNSWTDPKAMASELRTQLEAIWNAEREICKMSDKKQQREDNDDDSRNRQTTNDDQKKTEDGYQLDGSLGHNSVQQDSDDHSKIPIPKVEVTSDNQDEEQEIIYDGNKPDLQKDPDCKRCEEQIRARNSEDKDSRTHQMEEETAECQTGQEDSVLNEIRHDNNHAGVKASDNQEDMNDRIGTKRQMNDVYGENPNDHSRRKRPTIDVQEADSTSPDRTKSRKEAVQGQVIIDPDRKREHKDTDIEEDINNPDKKQKIVDHEEEIDDVSLNTNETKEIVSGEDMNDPDPNELNKDEIRKEDTHKTLLEKNSYPLNQSKEEKETACQKNTNDPDRQKRNKSKNANDYVVDVDDNQVYKKEHITDEQSAGQKNVEYDVMIPKDEKRMMKTKRKIPVHKDDKEKLLQSNEEQDEELGDNISVYENNTDAVNRNIIPDMWFYVSDSMVHKVTKSEVFESTSAYILLYEQSC